MEKDIMRLILASLAFAAASFTAPIAPALAQAAAASIAPGMQVVDTNGGTVGAVTAVKGDLITVKTDKHEVALPKTSFTPTDGKLLFGMTQAQLNAEAEKTKAQADAALTAGASVKGSGGAAVGTIDAVDAEFVTIKLQSGALVRVPRSGVAAGSDGVTIGLTAEELQAQVGATAATTETKPDEKTEEKPDPK
jgi:preprotein translocase subunit YajC